MRGVYPTTSLKFHTKALNGSITIEHYERKPFPLPVHKYGIHAVKVAQCLGVATYPGSNTRVGVCRDRQSSHQDLHSLPPFIFAPM